MAQDNWTYDIEPGQSKWDNASIVRTNELKQSEVWDRNGASGYEITQTLEGVKVVKRWFTTGPLAGKVRKLETYRDGKLEREVSSSYDEKGELVRVRDTKGGGFSVEKLENGLVRRAISESGQLLWEETLDRTGRSQKKTHPSGREERWTYEKDGSEIRRIFDPVTGETTIKRKNGKVVQYENVPPVALRKIADIINAVQN